jgi:hypothetical protein
MAETISEEDMAVVQGKLVELSDENFALESALRRAQDESREIPILRSRLASLQKAVTAESRAHEKETDALRAQLNPQTALSQVLKNLSRGRPAPDRSEELSAAEARLNDETDRLSLTVEIAAELAEQVPVIAAEVLQLDRLSARLKARVAEYELLQPQVFSCFGLVMFVQDQLGKLDQMGRVRIGQRGRRNRLVNWIAQTEEVQEQQKEAALAMDDELGEIAGKVAVTEAELARVREICGKRLEEYVCVVREIQGLEKKAEEMRREVREERAHFEEEIRKDEAEIIGIESATEALRGKIGAHDVSKRNLVQERLDMVQHLSKSLADERQKVRAIAISPQVIEELAQNVSTEMLEKQSWSDEVRHCQDRLKWLQAETQKKSTMISELRTMIIPISSDSRTTEATIGDFETLLADTQVQNECLLENLQIVGFEVAGLEDERASLLGILREMDS